MLGLIEASEILEFVLENGPLAMFVILFLCGCGLPLPEEIPLIASGVVVGFGKTDFWSASVACVAGILAGDALIFLVGRYVGTRYPKSVFVRFINNPKIEGFFAKHGKKTVFFARFFAGVRMGVYAYAGQHGMKFPRFIALDLLGALISGPTSIWLGKYAAERLGDTPEKALAHAQELLHDYKPLIVGGIVLLIAFIIGFAVWKTLSLRKQLKSVSTKTDADIARNENVGVTTPRDTSDPEARPDA
jgi:membrane protein DedA with SNARE-associated domain